MRSPDEAIANNTANYTPEVGPEDEALPEWKMHLLAAAAALSDLYPETAFAVRVEGVANDFQIRIVPGK